MGITLSGNRWATRRLAQLAPALYLALAASGAAAAETSLEKSPWFDPRYCYDHSPTEVIERLKSDGWFDCEACVDQALTVYAERVRPLVDRRHPAAAPIRQDLGAAIATFDRAFHDVTGGNWYGHEAARHAAWVEWFIVRTCERPDHWHGKSYSHADIRAVMLIWYQARVPADEADGPRPAPEAYAKTVDAAIAALARAERTLSTDQVRELRALVMARLARRL